MMKRYTFALFLFFCFFNAISGLAQLPYQGFEGGAGDTWVYTPSPAPYNVPADDDFWDDTTTISGITPLIGNQMWFMRDLENPNGGFAGFHTLDFQTIDLNGLNAGQVSFAYYTVEYEVADSIGYIIAFDNGTEWDMANYIDLNRNTGAWQIVSVIVPPGATHIRLRLMAKQNGGSDWAAFDDVLVEESLPPAVIGFDKKISSTNESAGTVGIQVNIANSNASPSSAKVSVIAASTALEGTDYILADTMVAFEGAATDPVFFQVQLPDDLVADAGKYLILKLSDFDNAEVGANTEHILLISDNDITAPAAQADPFIKMRHLGSAASNPTGGSAEIVAHDPISQRLFVVNSITNKLDILNFANPVSLAYVDSIDMSIYGGGINSVAVKNGVVAVAVQGDSTAANGKVVFFDTNGAYLNAVEVGNLPDMVIFSNDGHKVLTANEGEPNTDYTIDPEGSVSVIDISAGVVNATAVTLTFTAFNSEYDNLRAAGIRLFGPGATVAQDLEPEYICIDANDSRALVTLQENNAVAIIDLVTMQITDILPLGYKDYSQISNAFDASDRAPGQFFAPWKVKGMYLPDAIECFEVGGVAYAITANEGDARAYDGFSEEFRIKDLSLDPTAFPDASYLKKDELLGRLRTTNASGDTDGDGDFDEIYVFGGRSFSIWNTNTGQLVWDSGDDLERIVANDPVWGAQFNASNDSNTAKGRSDDKGPEPESVVVAQIEGRSFAFVGLERIGGIMAWEVTDPQTPVFVQYINTRALGSTAGGDLGPEGLIFIPKNESPNGRNLLVASNEISGTLSVFQLDLDRTNNSELGLETFDYVSETLITANGQDSIFEGGISGLHYIPGTDREFYAVSDRGPNAAATLHPNATGTTLLFLKPDFAPKITHFKAENGLWNVLSREPLLRPDGTPISGLPLPANQGSTGEVAWADTTPVVINPDVWGMDSEGIVEDNLGNLWLCDEYGSSVWKVNKTTKQVIKRYTPFPVLAEEAPLPASIGTRRPNRGFEGVAYTPNGKIYAIIQSPANNPSVTVGNTSRLLRLVEINPQTDEVKTFVYELDPAKGQIRTRDWKIGDMVAVNNTEFLVVEHAERNGWNDKNIYKIDISNATPLTTEDFNGQTLEQLGTAANAAAFGIVPVSKSKILDLLEAGWDLTHDKPEGLSILDAYTIAVVNDNDFGIDSPAEDGTVIYTGKTTRLYIYTLPTPLNYVLPYCDYAFEEPTVAICEGTTVSINAGADFAAYAWNTGATTIAVEVAEAGTYAVTVTNAVGCEASDSLQVSLLSLPAVSLGNDLNFCDGATATINAGDGFATYEWNTGATTSVITVAEPGDIIVTVTDNQGCQASDSILVTVLDLPVVSLGNNQLICEGESASLDAGAGFANYLWNTGAVTQSVEVQTTGEYTVTVTNGEGCSNSDEVVVEVAPLPVVNLGDDDIICDGQSAVLDAGAGFNAYNWSTNQVSSSIEVNTTGIYSVTVTAEGTGCTASDNISIVVAPNPVIDLGADTTVSAQTFVLDAGAGFTSYLWSTGTSTQMLEVVESGTYAVTVTDSNGCSDTDEIVVSLQPIATKEPSLRGELAVFPNPTSGRTTLRFADFDPNIYVLQVYDFTGKQLAQQVVEIQTIEFQQSLDLTGYPAGTYIVKISTDKGFMVHRIVLK